MEKGDARKFKRTDFSGEVKIRILEEEKEISVGAKDISLKGVRIIVGGRFLKLGTSLEIKMRIGERDILCKGKVIWVLTPRPGFGNINVFDVGIEFTEISLDDQEFLEKLFGK
jgi:hypothetical protein